MRNNCKRTAENTAANQSTNEKSQPLPKRKTEQHQKKERSRKAPNEWSLIKQAVCVGAFACIVDWFHHCGSLIERNIEVSY